MQQNKLIHMYRIPALSEYRKTVLLKLVREKLNPSIQDIETEFCFNIDVSEPLTDLELSTLKWLLSETFEPEKFSDESFIAYHALPVTDNGIFEVGPRMNFSTAWSTNAVSICHACGLKKINSIERSRRYKLIIGDKGIRGIVDKESLTPHLLNLLTSAFLELIHDRMTE